MKFTPVHICSFTNGLCAVCGRGEFEAQKSPALSIQENAILDRNRIERERNEIMKYGLKAISDSISRVSWTLLILLAQLIFALLFNFFTR